MDRDRQTATLNYEMSTVWGTKPRTSRQQTSGLLVGPEQVTRPKTLPDISMMMKRMTMTLVALKTQVSCKGDSRVTGQVVSHIFRTTSP
jgi:hypothetical protein